MAQKLRVGVPEWRDYTNADGSGIYFDLLRAVYPDHELDIHIDSYHRTLSKYHNKQIDIVIGAYREDITQGLLPNWFLDTESPLTAYYKADTTTLKHLSDFEHLTVSWIRGYKFENLISYVKQPYLVNTVDMGFKLLNKSRVDVFIDYPQNVPEQYEEIFSSFEVIPAKHLYLSFQKNKYGKILADTFDKQMATLRESGKLAAIYGENYHASELDSFNANRETMVLHTSILRTGLLEQKANVEPIEKRVLDLLIERNTEFNIELDYSTDEKNIQEREGHAICYSNRLKTQARLKQYFFSQPMTMYGGLRLFSKEPIKQKEPIDIQQLLAGASNRHLGLVRNRSYSEKIDKLIQHIDKSKTINLLGNSDTYINVFFGDRVDYIIEYPSIIKSVWDPVVQGAIYSYQIKGAPLYNLGHIMCEKSAEGKQIIDSVNKALNSLYQSEYFINIFYEKVDEKNKQSFYSQFKRLFSVEH